MIAARGTRGNGPRVAALDDLATAARKVAARHLRRLRECEAGTREGRDPEALHDMRVASRRLRSALRVFRDGLPQAQRARLGRELRWLGRLLGSVRDLDVHGQRVEAHRAALPRGAARALRGLEEEIRSQRALARTALLRGLASRRYPRLLADLEAWQRGEEPPPQVPPEAIASFASRRLPPLVERLLRDGDEAASLASPQALHRLRIRVKRARYLLEFLRDPAGKPGRRLVRDLVRFQDLLGEHQDAVVAADRICRYLRELDSPIGGQELAVLERLVGREHRTAEEIRSRFPARWRGFAGRETRRRVTECLQQIRSSAQAERRAAVRTRTRAGGGAASPAGAKGEPAPPPPGAGDEAP